MKSKYPGLSRMNFGKQKNATLPGMSKKIFITSLFIFSFFLQAISKDGYQIKVHFTDVRDSSIFLCHYYGKGSTVFKDDSLRLNSSGEGFFKSDKKIIGGIYMLLFADKSASMEIILLNGDNFSVDVTKGDIYQTAKFTGNSENNNFYNYQKFLSSYGKQYQAIESGLIAAKNKKDTSAVYDKMREKGKELTKFRSDYVAKNPAAFLSKLFNALEEPEIPTVLPTKSDGSKDSSYPREFYKSNYWKKYDFRDDRLIYTPIYERKLEDYFTKLVVPVPDTVEKEADVLLKKADGMEETFKYTLWYLTRWSETSKIMGMDEVFVYLVENYYMKGKATWIDSAQLAKYIKRAGDIAPNLIGKPAMDLRMLDTTNSTYHSLYDVKADYTILIFWSPTCGHCQKEIPKFDSLYGTFLKKHNVKIFAVEADNETEKWRAFIREHKLGEGWIHVHDPNRATKFRDFYDVYSTPTLYLLDDKKIIRGKRIDHENVVGLIEWLEKKKKRESEQK